jgi:hypothetical protein
MQPTWLLLLSSIGGGHSLPYGPGGTAAGPPERERLTPEAGDPGVAGTMIDGYTIDGYTGGTPLGAELLGAELLGAAPPVLSGGRPASD